MYVKQQDVEEVPSDLSDISYQAEVNPSPNGQVQNPAGADADDQFSAGPFQVQENAVPYNDGQSFGQVCIQLTLFSHIFIDINY